MISGGTKHFIKVAVFVMVAYWCYGIYDDWATQRAARKAEVDNHFRRERLTPEQRIAEDAAKAKQLAQQQAQQAEAARLAARDAEKKPYRSACLAALTATLNDPGSLQVTSDSGGVNDQGVYVGMIEGRAKNAFGALMQAGWTCEAVGRGGAIVVTSVTQYKP